MAKEYKIKWKQGDYIKLGQAVSAFNKKITELQKEEQKSYLPALKNYKEEKENILTRKEYNRVLNSLRSFLKEGAEDIVEINGITLTKWEKREINTLRKNYEKQLTEELEKIDKKLKPYKTNREFEIERSLKLSKNLFSFKGQKFELTRDRVLVQGRLDFKMRKAIQYQRNYLEEMKKYSHMVNYDVLMKKMLSIKNPIEFFDIASQNELMQDLTYISDMVFSQSDFNWFAEQWGVSQEELEDADDFKTDYMLTKHEVWKDKKYFRR